MFACKRYKFDPRGLNVPPVSHWLLPVAESVNFISRPEVPIVACMDTLISHRFEMKKARVVSECVDDPACPSMAAFVADLYQPISIHLSIPGRSTQDDSGVIRFWMHLSCSSGDWFSSKRLAICLSLSPSVKQSQGTPAGSNHTQS